MSIHSTRKIVSAAVLLTIGVSITLYKGDIPNNLLALMQWIYVAFVLGNGAEHFSKIITDKSKIKEIIKVEK